MTSAMSALVRGELSAGTTKFHRDLPVALTRIHWQQHAPLQDSTQLGEYQQGIVPYGGRLVGLARTLVGGVMPYSARRSLRV